MIVIHLKKKDIVKSKVRGIEIEFDHEKLATILGVPGANGICEYIKEVWEESKYTKPLEITRRFANDESIMAARRVKSGELKPFQRFVHFLMKQAVEGESGSERSFMMLEEEAQGSPELPEEIPADATPSSTQQKDKGIAGVDPSGPTSREADFLKFQAEFERKRANRFHDELEKAKAENAKLLALLHQAQTKPHP
ncbi:hypothetical protein Dimus_023166 [Dionaea muscipula]